jgi:hypothetical protein
MQQKFKPIEELPPISEERIDRSQLEKRADSAAGSETTANSQSVPVARAHSQQLPATYLLLEPLPLSAYDDNPVLNEAGAAFVVGLSADTLKKWRQRHQGPDYIQYGQNGVVRYELKALMEFRDKNRVKINNKN